MDNFWKDLTIFTTLFFLLPLEFDSKVNNNIKMGGNLQICNEKINKKLGFSWIRTGDLMHARRECNPLLYRGFPFKVMICQIYIIHNLNLDRKTFHLTFKIDQNKMVKWIKGVANLFMLYRLSNVLKLLLMIEQIRALRPVKKVNLATEDGWFANQQK